MAPRALSQRAYALKTADAATLGGLHASAFALAGSNLADGADAAAAISAAPQRSPRRRDSQRNRQFSGANTIVNSILYDNGTDVGIGTTTPSAKLSVKGTMRVDGPITLDRAILMEPKATATSSSGHD